MQGQRRASMYTIKPKKLMIINILEILNKYTDQDHTLTQKQIADILLKEYSMKADRKAIKRNLMNLIDAGYELKYDEVIRTSAKGEEETILTNWSILHKFDDSELRLIIDNLLFSFNLSHNDKSRLIDKIEGLSSIYFKKRMKHDSVSLQNTDGNKQLFYTISMLDEAIANGKQVQFLYNEIDLDRKMKPKIKNGKPQEYIINPYQMVSRNAAYYLICNKDNYDTIGNYRVDRISNIVILDSPVKPIYKLKECKNGFDLQNYMAEHIYMFPGESGMVTFRSKRYLMAELYDWFGDRMTCSDITDEELTVRVKVNLKAMRNWAVQYALHAKIISPLSLANEVKEDLKKAMKNYE